MSTEGLLIDILNALTVTVYHFIYHVYTMYSATYKYMYIVFIKNNIYLVCALYGLSLTGVKSVAVTKVARVAVAEVTRAAEVMIAEVVVVVVATLRTLTKRSQRSQRSR